MPSVEGIFYFGHKKSAPMGAEKVGKIRSDS